MVSFDSEGLIVDQIQGHHGLLEIYAHIFSTFFLFAMSLLSLFILFYHFKRSVFKYPALVNGIIYTGILGLGEAFEHIHLDPFKGSLFHYMHLLAAPIALLYFLMSLGEIYPVESGSTNKISRKKSLLLFIFFLLFIVLLSGFSTSTWDAEIEVPLVLISALPTLILVGILLERSKIISESTMAFISLRVILLGVSALTISILAGRYGDFTDDAFLYLVFHQFQNISHIVTGTALLIFVLTISQMKRLLNSD